jgi:chromosome segregation ATPase
MRRAKYLTEFDVDMITKLRGKEKPINIAKKYKIGLTRLYKIWTNASQNKKFPGGFAGTQAGKNLTETIKKLTDDVKIQREFINKTRTEHIENKKKSEKLIELVTTSRQQLEILSKKLEQLTADNQQKIKALTEQQSIADNLDAAIIKNNNSKQQLEQLTSATADNEQKIKALTEQHQSQLTIIDITQKKIDAEINHKEYLLSALVDSEQEIEILNDQYQRKLSRIQKITYEIMKPIDDEVIQEMFDDEPKSASDIIMKQLDDEIMKPIDEKINKLINATKPKRSIEQILTDHLLK